MQDVAWVNAHLTELLAIGQRPLATFEIYVAGAWVPLTALAGKHYVEATTISLGGATMTPDPITGNWSAMLANEGSIFHPDHPTSAYTAYCVAGREVRISIGARYAGVPRYWQRIIGHMEEPTFSAPDFKVNISGSDYMKRLADAEFQELDATYPNHWGAFQTYDSWPSDGLIGAEMYTNADAMDMLLEDDDVVGWTPTNCNFVSLLEGSGGSTYVGKMTGASAPSPKIVCADIGTNATAGKKYKVRFKHKIVGGDGTLGLRARIHQTALIKQVLYFPTNDWKEEVFTFTATDTAAIGMQFIFSPVAHELWLDQFSVWEYIPYEDRFYQLPGAGPWIGPYHVTLAGVPVWENDEDEGWLYEEATGRVSFVKGKVVPDGAGLNNVVIYYFEATHPEDAVARILWFAGVQDPATGLPYINEAAAKTAMDWDEPGFTIDKVWFKAGSSMLSAIQMLCERCNWRFYFKWDGQPAFKAAPAGGIVFTFTSPVHIASVTSYQDQNEIKNRVIIKGIKQADMGVGSEEGVPSELEGEANDAASIALYGERTLTINNYLFQTQGPLNAMCIILRDLYKTPKWYADLVVPFNPVPLELGDEIQWEERLAHGLNVTQTGIIRDIKISNFTTTYRVVKT